ncbi:hypothetical protein QQX09_00575 [Demequina sp. SYSU T00192]|uniref:Uncharacterized protein n=1 Tax=Demequina litoralis TaxID=3051660 RepID=A0ABT8G5C1_9MICO|nr:hypothetical protein [Demequina sp. SYSU T00192]MDN4474341.1 hypothetical protein [Demequina sp. SYSU T00192]
MSTAQPDDNPLWIEIEEFRELYAEDPTVADDVHGAVARSHPDRPALADAVVDSLVAGFDMHADEDAIEDVIEACARLIPLLSALEILRDAGDHALADLLESAPANAGRWLHQGGWAIHRSDGAEAAFMFARLDAGRAWVLLLSDQT